DAGKGPTILISPLLSLMRNQMETAERLGLTAATLNSDNVEEWEEVKEMIRNKKVDILLISPERLFSPGFQETMASLQGSIGLFVVDEAHCVSDWGHDFRPDYRRIVRVLQMMPSNVPVLATTATANERVIDDLLEQIGSNLNVIRGSLTRKSLRIQMIDHLKRQEERLAWLAENLPKINGSGIIYCLTKRDCRRVADWLQSQGINAEMYYGGMDGAEELEHRLQQNDVKALVATTALGMGCDKEDLAFVVHYQSPSSIVAYYQQIGRAGRKLEQADVILLTGDEDEQIHEFFIDTSFPKEENLLEVLQALENAEDDLTPEKLEQSVNMKRSKIEKCLKFLEVDGAVTRVSAKKYRRSFNPWKLDRERVIRVTQVRWNEWAQMKTMIQTSGCYMQFVARALDDHRSEPCGRCANCQGHLLYPDTTTEGVRKAALAFIRGDSLPIQVRKQWPQGTVTPRNIPERERTKPGRALSMYGDSVYGEKVHHDKYVAKRFRDELVEAAAHMIREKWFGAENLPTWVTCVPSRRDVTLVPDFAERLAGALGLPFYPVLEKVEDTEPQKEMENSTMRVLNIQSAFRVHDHFPHGEPVLLVDDIVDSAWTFTGCGVKLIQAGSGAVYPLALASAGMSGGDSD
ncbi:MAG: RecQ family ATP-dependent DNA helicase, partial [Tumebacillaceae bacterium]